MTVTRDVNSLAFTILDALLVFLLPFCLLNVALKALDFLFNMDSYQGALHVEYGVLTLAPAILSVFYILFVSFVAIVIKSGGFETLAFHPADEVTARPFFVGQPRLKSTTLSKHCEDFLFHHTYFRKHSYVFSEVHASSLY